MKILNKLSIVATLLLIPVLAAGCKNIKVVDDMENVAKNENSVVATVEDTVSENNEEAKVEEIKDIPVLRDAMEKENGMFAGCAVTGSEIDDEKVWEIITTHFSRVTMGNELKPDALFNYSNGSCPGTETVEFNGEEMVVPVLNYSRAEKILDKFYDWNQENPDRQIKIRGHVLVWHSQTPEWFFHEDYVKTNPYVDKETMNKRLEWYIATVLTHFTGEDSKYKDMFYGWDVVNEAVADSNGKIRTDKENPNESKNQDTHNNNSSWWTVYGSEEFIINAFKYANKYAPADLELYYNDYNECSAAKLMGIRDLLQEIKDAEGAPGEGTRISAMGMQGHYNMTDPDYAGLISAISFYCKIVGKVQFTEVDIKTTDKIEDEEAFNEELRKRYNVLNAAINGAKKQNSENVVEGITWWGTVDHYSWLQSRNSVGGGNTSGLSQMPLLFDKDYQPKACFYVFAKDEK